MFKTAQKVLARRRFRQIIALLIFISIVIGFLIVPIERAAPNSNIHTYFDGLWWVITTITTVGYGDYVPVTVLGRIVGIYLQILGTLLFGMVLATISIALLRRQEDYNTKRIFEHLNRIESKLESINKKSEYLVKENGEDN